MQNFGGMQQNMNYMMQQMGTGQEFPVPITSGQSVPQQLRKQRNTKKFLAPPQAPQQPHQLLMLQQQQQQIPQFQPLQAPPPAPQITQMDSIPGPIVPNVIGQQQQQQQRKNQPMRPVQPAMKPPNPQPQQKIDRETFFFLSEYLCSFSWMDSVETDWVGDNINPEIHQVIENADDDEADLNFNSISDYINVSNDLFQQK